jgi:hypothetical protein
VPSIGCGHVRAGRPHPSGTLSQLVMIDGNQMLMDESDDGARA